MKRILTALCAGLLAACMLTVPAFAQPQLDTVTDDAGLLSQEEIDQLTGAMETIGEETGCGVYLITVNSPDDYTEASDIEEAAGNLYFDYDYGVGEDNSGILLLVAVEDRQMALYAYGYGNEAFTDYGKRVLLAGLRNYLGEDDWYGGFADYANNSSWMIQLALEGEPLDVSDRPIYPEERAAGVAGCLVLALILAFVVRSVLKRQLRSVAFETNANAFVCGSSVTLGEQYDRYTHTTTSRRYDPPDKDSGGGTTTDSRGGSSASSSF